MRASAPANYPPAPPKLASLAAPKPPLATQTPKPTTKVKRSNPKDAIVTLPRAEKHSPTRLPIMIKLLAPAARDVCVVGTFNHWQVGATRLDASPSGEWQAELQLAPGRYEYLFVVDGRWTPDPVASEAAENPFGGKNSVLLVA